ncbi:hypothetical protein HYN43_008260 [Mucilaginibacter celer]|uniref:Uncharacterized protein n=2 Tax=Mucilaginibacter celer TaxID=2305508 RepID=A0A494VVG2_9SPHI|nr:hypothetical protein HYN43_008260 [Mucilaginibacter celer]
MFRLTWNTNDWQTPVKHKWRAANQGNSNIAFENQYGFGGEEWLFNTRYQQDGFQYGYIRGANELHPGGAPISTAYLFTIQQETGERYLVGRIRNLEIIGESTRSYKIAEKLFNKYKENFLEEIDIAEGDRQGIETEGFIPNVRFKFTGDELFEKPVLVPGLNGRRYNRFKPYYVDAALLAILNGHLPKGGFVFNPGVARNSTGFERHTTASGVAVKRHHSTITNALKKFLQPDFTEAKGNLSIEKTSFGVNTADIVLLHKKNEISIIEVKTSGIARKNVREAIGQLIDYAYWFDDIIVHSLIIVSPTPLSSNERDLIRRFQSHFKLKLEYWQYLENITGGQPSFTKHLS